MRRLNLLRKHDNSMVRTNSLPANNSAAALLTVYFDGGCPVCQREIAHYRSGPGAEAFAWVDAAHCTDEALGPGLQRQAALQRFHVRLPDGRLLRGSCAFAALWKVLPGWVWLGRLASAWPVRPLFAVAYAVFLQVRRLWRRPGPKHANGVAPASLPSCGSGSGSGSSGSGSGPSDLVATPCFLNVPPQAPDP